MKKQIKISLKELFETRIVEFFIYNGNKKEYYKSIPDKNSKSVSAFVHIHSMYNSYIGDTAIGRFTYLAVNDKAFVEYIRVLCITNSIEIPYKELHIVCSYSKTNLHEAA